MTEDKIGSNIRKIRLEKGMTLKELGEKAELSISYLSMLERGLCSLSLATLQNIAEALDVNKSELTIPAPDPENGLVRSYQRPSIKLEGSTLIYNYLVDDKYTPRKFNPIKVTILPSHSIIPTVPYKHGGEEFIYVLEGTLTLILDKQSYSLSEGDSTHYNSSIPHEWLNYTDRLVVVLAINSYPHADYYGDKTE
ncbi:MAG: cupin domain-containing protein [Clostridiaceae bacterium]|nr:cupin domain-containing protein [Clostridiaceae bacterium]